MALSQALLEKLEEAYASGALEVTFEGQTIKYGNEADLRRRITFVQRRLNAGSGKKAPSAGFAHFSRG